MNYLENDTLLHGSDNAWVGATLRSLARAMPRLGGADLATAALSGLNELPGVRWAVVALNPDQVHLVDPDWRRRNWCCAGAAGSPPVWLSPAGGWTAMRDAARDGVASPELTATAASEFALAGAAAWRGAFLQLRHHDIMALLVAMAPDADPERVAGGLQQMQQGFAVLSSLLADTQSARSELARMGGENNAMSRLNHLQGRYVAMASHEFKAPLTAITAYTDVLKSQLKDDAFPHAREFLDVIRSESDRLLRMVNRILDFTRVEYGSQLMRCESVELEPLVREAVRSLASLAAEKEIEVRVVATPGLPRAEVDADLIRQVMVNLLSNALKFTPRGGRVVVNLAEEDSAVAVGVVDNGPGIPAEDIRRIFRDFYRTESTEHVEGSGLGLSIARHIVQLHGGHIEALRRPEGGSEFRFLVPKQTDAFATLGEVLGASLSAEEAARLVDALLRLLAELTGSSSVALLLRDGKGALVPVGAMGMTVDPGRLRPVIETEGWSRFLSAGRAESNPGAIVGDLPLGTNLGRDRRMFCPLGHGDHVRGLAIVGRRADGRAYDEAELSQVGVLAEVVRNAIDAADGQAGATHEALQTLLRIRRTGVPTSTPQALALTERLSARLHLPARAVRRVLLAATLHDAGMARVEDEIVLGASPLSWDERDEVDRHVEQGVALLDPLLPDTDVREIIRHHHERWDGCGYPDGLVGEDIPVGARVLAVIDAWFSLTQERPFRAGVAPELALAEIRANTDTQFDPRVVREFSALLAADGVVPLPGADVPQPHGN